MLSFYLKALFKRANTPLLMQFKPPILPQRIYSQTGLLSAKKYTAYCAMTQWKDAVVLHPCFIQMCSLPLQMQCLLDPKSPFALLGLVHIRNQIVQLSGCRLDAQTEMRARFNAIRAHTAGWEIDIEVTAIQQGCVVYTATSTYLSRVRAPHVAPRKRTEKRATASDSGFEDTGTLHALDGTGRSYASLSGDFNPIHLHAVSARLFGFKRAIAHGMWSLATSYALYARNQQSVENAVMLSCEFARPLMLPGEARVLVKAPDSDTQAFMLTDVARHHVFLHGTIGRPAE